MRFQGSSIRWGVIGALATTIAIASPAAAHNTPQEEANKKVVLDFYSALNDADAAGTTAQQAASIITKYIAPNYMQHSEAFNAMPGTGTARDKLIARFQGMPAMKGPPMPRPKTEQVMAQGDRVMLLTSRQLPSPSGAPKTAFIFNMFRVEGGQLVEHWDVMPAEMTGPPPGGAGAPPQGPGGPPPGAPPAGMPAGAPPAGFTPPGAN
ncbi:hypothetical protein WSK_1517 [Novosphingobium sp. Rr 2-17]|uniref:nuclear transport factor 2 family protein n=1 Tax=Novosphingobium sp. Rr 2-17 TaxID=555793 RepID=UPI00026994F4|nr:nuclear transport factor 2 family protein [Novosphingobium sp. Rr 2-17]EIZ79922.1 hypothetical protein WSK_1517 [Novosphingobium sp. Rr 2-17]